MYRILIADDEKGFCNLLEKSINRMEGFQVIGKANDGERALQLVAELRPDILITDINMPKLSGLELLQHIQAIDENIETLVISGYSEFSYAKSAMALGVNDYLVKPFLPDELLAVLQKMGQQIETRKDLAENLRQLQAEADSNRVRARHRFLGEVFAGERSAGTEAALLQQAKALGMPLDFEMYCVCVARVRPPVDNLADLLQTSYLTENFSIYGMREGKYRTVLLFSGNEDSELLFYKRVGEALKHTSANLADRFDTHMWCAVGNIYHNPLQISVSYLEAISVWRSKLAEDESIVCYGALVTQNAGVELERPIELENRLLRLILSSEKERAVECLHQIMQHYSELCLYNAEFVSVSLVKLVFSISEVRQKADKEQAVEDGMVLDYLKHHFTKSSLREAAAVLEQYVRDACVPFRSLHREHTDKLVYTLKELIEENIPNEEFSLENAAAQVYFSANYIRQLFKQKVGESFMEYLIRRRMETARTLLVDSTMQIQRIAEQTGYSNSRYFASCFKKYYGCTPSECRSGAAAIHPPKEE